MKNDVTKFTVTDLLPRTIRTIADAGIASARLDAELIVAHVLGVTREHLIAFDEERVNESQLVQIDSMVADRARHRPLQYVLGVAHFWDFTLTVDERVLIPRPETEQIVELLTGEIDRDFHGSILDICTGSGCLAIACARLFPYACVTACELSNEALNVARGNATRLGVAIDFVRADLTAPFADAAGFDVIVANPPYVANHEFARLARNVRDYEPKLALTGIDNGDGFAYVRRIVADLPRLLGKGGVAMIETGETVGRFRDELAVRAGSHREFGIVQDYAGKDRFVIVRK